MTFGLLGFFFVGVMRAWTLNSAGLSAMRWLIAQPAGSAVKVAFLYDYVKA